MATQKTNVFFVRTLARACSICAGAVEIDQRFDMDMNGVLEELRVSMTLESLRHVHGHNVDPITYQEIRCIKIGSSWPDWVKQDPVVDDEYYSWESGYITDGVTSRHTLNKGDMVVLIDQDENVFLFKKV